MYKNAKATIEEFVQKQLVERDKNIAAKWDNFGIKFNGDDEREFLIDTIREAVEFGRDLEDEIWNRTHRRNVEDAYSDGETQGYKEGFRMGQNSL